MASTVQANVANAQVTNTSGGVTFDVSNSGDVITGGVDDNFVIQDSGINYNTYNETSGGTMLAGTNNALFGFATSFSAATGITTLSANGHTGVLVGSEGATLNLTGVTLSNVGVRLDQLGQTVTAPQTGLNYTVITYNDTINGGGNDVYTVVDSYLNYNSYNDVSGGTVQAGTNNALLAFSNSLSTADGISTLSANGYSGVQAGSEGAVLNTTGMTLNGVGISLGQNGQIVTVPQSGLNYTVSTYGDTINAGGGDTFTVVDPYIEYNSYNDVAGGTLQAGTNNALLGFSNSLTAADGISKLSANGHTGVYVGSNGATLNLTGITLTGVGVDLSETGQTVTAPQTGLNYRVSNWNDVINGGGNDTFTVVDDYNAYNAYNTYNDVSGGTLQAGTNDALLGIAGNFSEAATGITTIAGNGYSGVTVGGTGAVLNLSGVALSDVAIAANQTTAQTITTTAPGLSWSVSGNNATLNGAGHDTFTVNTVYNFYNTYNEPTGGCIIAGENNAFIGMAGNVVDGNGVAAILGNGTTGAMVGGNGAIFNLAGVRINDVGINANQNNQTITTTQGGVAYQVSGNGDVINGVGGDTFTVKTAYNYYNSYNDLSGGTIQAGFNNAVIGLSGAFGPSNGIISISGNGFTGVAISGNTAGATLDFSQTSVSDATIRGGANNVTIIGPSGNQTLTGGGTGDVFAFTAGTGQDVITDFRAGSGAGYDVIDLNGALSVPNFATLLTHIQQVGANAVITLNNGGTITLDGVNVSSLKANNFNMSNLASGLSASNGSVTVGHGQTVNLTSTIKGLITQGTLDGVATATTVTGLSSTDGSASVTSGVANYTAPANGTDTASYSATDQFGDQVSGQITVTVDTGPIVANGALTIGHGQSEDVTALISGLITKGLAGDTETVTSTSGDLVQNAQGHWIYTAPASGNPNATFTVTDQLGDTASGQIAVTVDPGPSAADTPRAINLSTGQNTSGVIQSANDSLDANWQITGAVAPQDAPNAYVVASNGLDFGNGGWLPNDASSSWIAAAPNNPHGNGNMDATDTFTLTASDIAHISSAAGEFLADDSGAIYINGHELASAVNAWGSWNNFTIPTADLVVGTNTLSLVTSNSDDELEGVRVNASLQIGSTGFLTIGHGQSQDVTALVNGLVTPGATGDTETVTSNSADLVQNAQGHWIYTAPAGQTTDTPTFTVTDQYGDSTTGSIAVSIDQGPTVGNGSVVVGHNQNTYLNTLLYGLVTPGLAGDTETITAVSGAHAYLGGGNMIYGSPTSGTGSFTYTVTDQVGDSATGHIAVTVDPGPTVASGSLTIGHGQSQDVTSLINGLITKGLAGDTETVASTSGDLVKNAQGHWIYTAPASGSPNATFTVTDQVGDTANGQIVVAVDAGPTVANGTLTIGHGQSQDVTALINGLITKGLVGDAEAITSTSGNLVQNAQGHWIYTTPASGNPNATFTVIDQLGEAASGQIAVTLDAGPTVANGTLTLGHGQSQDVTALINGLITKGLVADAETIASSSGDLVQNAQGHWIYTAPASGNPNASFTVTDQLGDVANGQIAVTVDAGPTVANGTLTIGRGQSQDVTALINGLITKGLAGDIETVTATSGNLVKNAEGAWIYTAPASGTSDSFSYQVTDQLGDVASGSVAVTIPAPPVSVVTSTVVNLSGYNNDVVAPVTVTPPSSVAGDNITGPLFGNATITGTPNNITITAQGYNNTIIAGGGNDTVNAGLSNADVTVSNGAGNNIVQGSVGMTSVVLGNGNDTISLGGYNNTVQLGSGNSTVDTGVGGANVVVGNGNNTITAAGYSNSIIAGSGDNSINAGAGNTNVQIGTGSNAITVGGSYDVIHVAPSSGASDPALITGINTLVLGGYDDTVTLGSADNSVTGSQGYLTLTTGNGDQDISANGYGNVINVGLGSTNTGSSIISAGTGNATVKVSGTGTNVITAEGYDNTIVVGGGQNVINAGQGYETVSAGTGNSIITAQGYDNEISIAGGTSTVFAGQGYDTVNVGASSANVTLNGYQNVVIGGESRVVVSGGADNIYQLNGFGDGDGMSIDNFSANNGDVLDLSNVLSHTDWNHEASTLSNFVNVTEQGNDTIIGINSAGVGGQFVTAATLQNMGPTTLDTLLGNHSLNVF